MSEQFLRAYVRLSALRKHCEKEWIHERFVNEYHEIITQLTVALRIPLNEFRIPTREMQFFNRRGVNQICDGSFFRSKIDALLSYFEIKYNSETKEKSIGFNTDFLERQ